MISHFSRFFRALSAISGVKDLFFRPFPVSHRLFWGARGIYCTSLPDFLLAVVPAIFLFYREKSGRHKWSLEGLGIYWIIFCDFSPGAKTRDFSQRESKASQKKQAVVGKSHAIL
jgi:hypothetical protein